MSGRCLNLSMILKKSKELKKCRLFLLNLDWAWIPMIFRLFCANRRIRAFFSRSEERRVGKSVDLGGRRIIKKKKKKKKNNVGRKKKKIKKESKKKEKKETA